MRIPPTGHPKVKVTLTWMSPGNPVHLFVASLLNLQVYVVVGEKGGIGDGCTHVVRGGRFEQEAGPLIVRHRNNAVEEFLSNELFRDSEWLLMIDADMSFDPDALCRLLASAYGNSKATEPRYWVIGALCFAARQVGLRPYPTIYSFGPLDPDDPDSPPVPRALDHIPQGHHGVIKVAGTGAAFLLVHRKVLMHMVQPAPTGFGTIEANGKTFQNPAPWFVEGQIEDRSYGEDLAFCQRVQALGYGVYVDTTVETGHWKRGVIDRAAFEAWSQAQEATDDDAG
jgi:hypothetical protein